MAVSNITCSMVFGHRYQYDDERFKRALASLNSWMYEMGRPTTLLLFLPLAPTLLRSRMKEINGYYAGFSNLVLEQIVEHKKRFDGSVNDFIDAYLAEMAATSDTDIFTDRELRYVIQDLFLAGSETTFTTLRWLLLYMAAYPEVQRAVQAELDSVIGAERPPSMADKKRTPYTEAVLNEVQRFNTLVSLGVPHTNNERDVEIRGYRIPKGVPVAANLYAVHRNPKLWKNPEKFDPTNFLDEQGRIVNLDQMVQFSVGRRSCAGEALARMELYLFFTSWMKAFHVKLETDSTQPDLASVGLALAQPRPHLLRLVPRAGRA